MTLLYPYESAEALCRRRNKVSTAAEWQVVWADIHWYVPAMMSHGRESNFKSIIVDTYESVEALNNSRVGAENAWCIAR